MLLKIAEYPGTQWTTQLSRWCLLHPCKYPFSISGHSIAESEKKQLRIKIYFTFQPTGNEVGTNNIAWSTATYRILAITTVFITLWKLKERISTLIFTLYFLIVFSVIMKIRRNWHRNVIYQHVLPWRLTALAMTWLQFNITSTNPDLIYSQNCKTMHHTGP